MLPMNKLLRKTIFKLFFFVIEDTAIGYECRCFQLYRNDKAIFGLLKNLHKLQEMAEKTLKCYCIIFI